MDEICLQIVLVGDESVGKTSLLNRYIDDIFSESPGEIIGVEYRTKYYDYEGNQIELKIWDTAGQEKYHSITNNYIRTADGIIFMYDITNKKTYEGIKKWMKNSDEISNNYKKILLGNKCDLESKREVSEVEVHMFSEEENVEFYETSTKDNINVKYAFNKIVELMLKDKTEEEINHYYISKQRTYSVLSADLEPERRFNCC